jgi:hypothetical protein
VAVAGIGAGVPFCHAVLTDDRAGLLARLRSRRVFATALWPDAVVVPGPGPDPDADPYPYPQAATLARHLLALPVDQRYTVSDMERLAALVLDALPPQP